MISSISSHTLQIFIIVFAFQTNSGVCYEEQMMYAFTDEERCEASAREVMFSHYKRINGLFWWCEKLEVNP